MWMDLRHRPAAVCHQKYFKRNKLKALRACKLLVHWSWEKQLQPNLPISRRALLAIRIILNIPPAVRAVAQPQRLRPAFATLRWALKRLARSFAPRPSAESWALSQHTSASRVKA